MHAFENMAQPVYSHCVLLKPNGTPVPTTFCFHIRRDLFDLPSLVIGVFHTPILPSYHGTDDLSFLWNRAMAPITVDRCF
jgi:hypothetical protein